MSDLTKDAVHRDIGIDRRSTLPARAGLPRTDLARTAYDVTRRGTELLDQSAPEGLVARVIDVIAPTPARKERRRAEAEIMRQEADAQVAIHGAVTTAKVQEIEVMADAWVKSMELEAAKEVAARGLDAATEIGDTITDSGAAFDRRIDEEVARARALNSDSAKESAADRIDRLKEMRAEVERAAMEGVESAIRGDRSRR